jgi:hypothetical protein
MIKITTIGTTENVAISGTENYVAGGPNATTDNITLTPRSIWVGYISTGWLNPVTVTGAGVFDNTDSNICSTTVIGVDVVGTGIFHVGTSHSQGNLTFMHGVPATQSVEVCGGKYTGYGMAILQVDRPHDFHAPVTLGLGEVLLEGLKASSYSFDGSKLSLFCGNKIVDTLKLAMEVPMQTSAPAAGYLSVKSIGGAVVLTQDYTPMTGAVLPLHG